MTRSIAKQQVCGAIGGRAKKPCTLPRALQGLSWPQRLTLLWGQHFPSPEDPSPGYSIWIRLRAVSFYPLLAGRLRNCRGG